jgi:hypothetical protein
MMLHLVNDADLRSGRPVVTECGIFVWEHQVSESVTDRTCRVCLDRRFWKLAASA